MCPLGGGGAAAGGGAAGGAAQQGIYQFNGRSGKPYVGQSRNIPSRLAQHARSGKLPPESEVSTTEVVGGKTAREIVEQRRINELGGIENVENERNPIGPKRRHLLDDD